jgi:hypothetical protein
MFTDLDQGNPMPACIQNQVYEFVPPQGSVQIKILVLQDYSPGQARKVHVWRVEPPPELASCFGGHVEFDNWKVLIATLARMFCDGDEKAASDRMVLKWSDRPPLGG